MMRRLASHRRRLSTGQVASFRNPTTVHKGGFDTPMDYVRGWAWQNILWQQPDRLLVLQHQPVYTLGRAADETFLNFLESLDLNTQNKIRQQLSRQTRGPGTPRLAADRAVLEQACHDSLDSREAVDRLISLLNPQPVLAPNNVPIYRVERGGEVTFHGPGQLVVYPILHLEHYRKDLHWFLRQVESAIIDCLADLGIRAERDSINTGVWVRGRKIAAVGIAASRWTTTHGLALNVTTNLGYFESDLIVPCGIEERSVTSIEREIGPVSLREVAALLQTHFGRQFGMELEEGFELT